jgi:hypothetical protein
MKKMFIVSLVIFLFVSALLAGAEAIARTYSTNFPLTENPISERGNWINGGTTGLDWHDVRTQTSPFSLAYGLQGGGANYSDATAIITGMWGPDQMVQATVYVGTVYHDDWPELELRLRCYTSAHNNVGYEVTFGCMPGADAYLGIGRWNGALGNFTTFKLINGSQAVIHTGDVIRATIVGNTITAYICPSGTNCTQRLQATDMGQGGYGPWTTGEPGIGMNQWCSSGTCYGPANGYGFTSFTASDEVAASSAGDGGGGGGGCFIDTGGYGTLTSAGRWIVPGLIAASVASLLSFRITNRTEHRH